jgi:hypothetical protein
MLYEMMSATEYGVLKGYSEKSTRVHQIIRSGKFPAEWVQAPKKIVNFNPIRAKSSKKSV